MIKTICVSAGIIRNPKGEILIGRRQSGGSCGELWEFPGGKQEPGETPGECLIRECQEELGCTPAFEKTPCATITHTYPDVCVHLIFFNGTLPREDNVQCRVHKALKWVLPVQLTTYSFCPADQQLIEQLAQYRNK